MKELYEAKMAAQKSELTASIKEEYRVYFDDYKAKFQALDAEKDEEVAGLKKKLSDITVSQD